MVSRTCTFLPKHHKGNGYRGLIRLGVLDFVYEKSFMQTWNRYAFILPNNNIIYIIELDWEHGVALDKKEAVWFGTKVFNLQKWRHYAWLWYANVSSLLHWNKASRFWGEAMAETRLIFHLQCVIQKAQIQPSDAKHWVLLTGDAKNAPVCVLAGMLHLCFTKKNGLVSQMHKAEATTTGVRKYSQTIWYKIVGFL